VPLISLSYLDVYGTMRHFRNIKYIFVSGDVSQSSRRPKFLLLALRQKFSDETAPQRARQTKTPHHRRVATAATTGRSRPDDNNGSADNVQLFDVGEVRVGDGDVAADENGDDVVVASGDDVVGTSGHDQVRLLVERVPRSLAARSLKSNGRVLAGAKLRPGLEPPAHVHPRHGPERLLRLPQGRHGATAATATADEPHGERQQQQSLQHRRRKCRLSSPARLQLPGSDARP
jgi:hypothetical protein